MQKKKFFYAAMCFLTLLSLLATIKICFFHLNIDEEYAVTLSCRILSEDRMFLEIWEPHQTSGFLAAALCWIYRTITGTSEYLVLYLRICGALLQAVISIFLYRTLRLAFSPFSAMTAAFFFYNTLPKQIQTPEFSNMLVWFSVLILLCLFRACHTNHSRRWLAAAGVFICGLVLSYPSCILAVPVYFLCLKKLRPRSFGKDAGIVFTVCVVLGIGYLAFFLSQMTLPQFLFGLRQMMTDSYHSDSLLQRLISYGGEIAGLLPHLCLVVLLGGICSGLYSIFVLKSDHKGNTGYLFSCCVLCAGFVEQLVVWLGGSRYFHYPLLYFYLLYGAGIFVYRRMKLSQTSQYRTLFWAGSVCGGCVWLAALLVTNTTVSVTGSYLICGLISAIVFLMEEREWDFQRQEKGAIRYKMPALLTAVGLLGTTLFAKGLLVCGNDGVRSDVFLVRQKALSGPAGNVYYAYVDGYAYNSFAELMEGCTAPEDSLLYVGQHNLYYLLTEGRIAVPSTISTPTYDSRLAEYWNCFPDHFPSLVVIDKGYDKKGEVDYVMELLHLSEPFLENAEFAVYKVE